MVLAAPLMRRRREGPSRTASKIVQYRIIYFGGAHASLIGVAPDMSGAIDASRIASANGRQARLPRMEDGRVGSALKPYAAHLDLAN
jgi:hypothetical protein